MKKFSATQWALNSIVNLHKKAEEQTTITSDDDVAPDSGINTMDPSLMHYLWLADAMSKLFNRTIDYRFQREFQVFLLENKSKIDRIMSTGSTPKFLGKGQDGVALQLGDFVLKIFLNDQTFQDAKQALTRLHTEPDVAKTEAMMYDVGTLGVFLKNNIYYYIIEKMVIPDNNVKNLVRPIMETIIKYLQSDKEIWEYLRGKYNDPATRKDFVPNIKKEIEEITKIVFTQRADVVKQVEAVQPNLKPTWVASLAEEIVMKFLTNRTDVNTGNLGVSNNGEFRYFDSSSGTFERVDPDTGKIKKYKIDDKIMDRQIDVLTDEDETNVTKN